MVFDSVGAKEVAATATSQLAGQTVLDSGAANQLGAISQLAAAAVLNVLASPRLLSWQGRC